MAAPQPHVVRVEDLADLMRRSMAPLTNAVTGAVDNLAAAAAAAPPPAAPAAAPAAAPPVPGGDVEKDIKCPRFYNDPSEDFLEWKASALRSLEGKTSWTRADKNRYLLSNMRKSAAVACQHMRADHPDYMLPANPNALMDALEKLFVTEGGTAAARQAFRDASQQQGEGLQRWHTRVVSLFRRAHPAVADIDRNEELRERFIFGLNNHSLGREVMRTSPTTITEAMNTASRFKAIDDSYRHARGGGRHSINALGAARRGSRSRSRSASRDSNPPPGGVHGVGKKKEKRRCHGCKKIGHLLRNCPEVPPHARRGPQSKIQGHRGAVGNKGKSRPAVARAGKVTKKNFSAAFVAAMQNEMGRMENAEQAAADSDEEMSQEPETQTGNGGSRA